MAHVESSVKFRQPAGRIEDAPYFTYESYCYRAGLCSASRLSPHPKNARTHSRQQVRKLERSIKAHGFGSPLVIDENFTVLAGHARRLAAINMNLETVPVYQIKGLSEVKKRSLLLADNRIAADAGWDRALLAVELPELRLLLEDEGFEIEDTGFEIAEIDQLAADFSDDKLEEPVDLSPLDRPTVGRLGDQFRLGQHLLLVADACQAANFERLLGENKAAAAFLDSPYNVPPAMIGGRGQHRHGPFAMGSGEMSPEAFESFLDKTHRNVAACVRDGGLVYSCMDWRSVDLLIRVGRTAVGELIALAIWVKTNAGQGNFYRSQHETIPVFRVGASPHQNNIQQGRFGRNRPNVWPYPGTNTFRQGRLADLADHPTVKNTAMVADAIKDCTRPGEWVLDCFGGSGTTLLACEKVGRRGALMELDPGYADVIIMRWQKVTGKDAIHTESGQTFDDLRRARGEAPKQTTTRVRVRA